MTIIDTHAHIYSPDEKRYPPIAKPLRPPGGAGSVEQLQTTAAANGVERVCAVQVSTFYGFDNRYILDSSKANPKWVAGVCTLDPDDPASAGKLAAHARDYGVKGMRSIPARNGVLNHEGVRALWKAALDAGIVINVLVGGRDKEAELTALLNAFPKLPVVLDHCMNLKAGPEMGPTMAAIQRLARHRNLHAKLTFIPTGSGGGYPCANMHEACLAIIETFGAERCIWGSDFPNALWTPKVSYAEHLRIFSRDLPLKDAARAEILGGTAARLWFRA